MLIDTPTTIPPPDARAAPRALAPELQALVAELKLAPGQMLAVSVDKVSGLSVEDRHWLLQNRAAPSPPSQAPSRELPESRQAAANAMTTQLQNLLLRPQLQLVQLSHQHHKLHTLSDLPLQPGDNLQVRLTHRGLQLIPQPSTANPAEVSIPANRAPLPSTHVANVPPTTASPTPADRSPQPPLAREPLYGPSARLIETAAQSPQPSRSTPAPEALAHKQLLSAAIAQTLPKAQSIAPLMQVISVLEGVLTSLKPQTLPPEARQLLALVRALTPQTITASTPIAPQQLRRAIDHSGVLFERQLATLSQIKTAPADLTPKPGGTPPPVVFQEDIKSLLIQLQQWLQTPPSTTKRPTAQGDAWLMSLMRLLSPKATQPASRQALQHILAPLVDKALAQIQWQQYRSLSSKLAESPTPAALHLDIPVKLGDHQSCLYLQFFDPPMTDRAPQRKKRQPAEKKQRWRVFMALNLGELGDLAAEIAVCGQQVEATLWAEKETLRRKTDQQLHALREQLQQRGMVVTDLRCSPNPPPPNDIRMDCALVDIRT